MENELTHWGIKNMKWGVRRYQNKDGSLTPAGKKRYAKEMAKLRAEEKVLKNRLATKTKLDKLEEKRKEVEALKSGKSVSKKTESTQSQSQTKRSIKDLSDEELNQLVNRMRLEQQYSQMKPKEVSAGKKFVDKVLKDVIIPASTEVGKELLKTKMKTAAGLPNTKEQKKDK